MYAVISVKIFIIPSKTKEGCGKKEGRTPTSLNLVMPPVILPERMYMCVGFAAR
jgi:hypothetical protein